MDAGTGLLWIGLILAAGSALAFAAEIASGARPYRRLGRTLLASSVAVVTGAFALMVYAFLTLDLSIAYVHAHTRADYPWFYRLAGAWSGDVGSILLWAWILSLVAVLFAFGGRKDTPSRTRLRVMGSALLSLLLTAFLYVLIVADPFRPTPATYLITEGTTEGLGLSPVLLTPLVIVHPPLEFLAYALVAIPFAASLSYLLLGRGEWAVVAMQWTRAAWLFLTLAIIIGALWAYTSLGWGGYWAWDPVETSNLLVWIPLTGLVHAQLWLRRKRQFPHLSVLLTGVVFALAMFATFETRTGILLSVHSFTPASGVTSSDLGGRLVASMAPGSAVPYFFALMVVALLATAASFLVFFMRLRRRQGIRRSGLLLPAVFLGVFVAAIVWTLADPQGIVLATLGATTGLGFGNASMGIVILAGVLLGIPLLWTITTSPDKEEPREREAGWISDDGTIVLAVGLFLLWASVTMGLMLASANSLSPSVFEQRLPFLLLPLGAVLFTALAWRCLGRRRVTYALLALGFAIVASYVLFSSNLGGLYFPLALALIFAAAFQIGKSWAPAVMPRSLRLAASLILGSLLLGLVMWSSGIGQLPGLGAETSLPWNVLGAAASLVGIALLALGISRHDRRLWLASGALGAVLLGFLVGSVLAIVALILLARSGRHFRPETDRRAVALTSILRASSPPLVHLGVALVLLGYAASSYFGAEAQVTATTDTATQSFSGYEFRLVRSGGLDLDADGRYEVVTAEISVARGGVPQFVASLQIAWRSDGVATARYLPEPFVHSEATADLSFALLAFSDGTRTYSVNDASPVKARSDVLTSAVFHVKESPLMVPLWGGGWIMAVGMGIRMWSERRLVVRERPDLHEEDRGSARTPPSRSRGEDHYRKLLDAEIAKEDPR